MSTTSIPGFRDVELICAPLHDWQPGRAYDLITCVHGLHYLGDKLGAIERAATWLTSDGRLVASFDARCIRDEEGQPIRRLGQLLRDAGFDYDARHRLLGRSGPGTGQLGLRYLGADDGAGPNYTGQPAVHSYYVL